jgi:RHS repeat-associated protein
LTEFTLQDSRNGNIWSSANPAPKCACPPNSTSLPDGSGCACNDDYVRNGGTCILPAACSDQEIKLGLCTPPEEPGKNNGTPQSCTGSNPCNPATGMKYQEERVFASPTLQLTLAYNSRSTTFLPLVPYPFGKNWSFNYGMRVWVTYQDHAGVQRPDGQILEFVPPPSGDVYLSDADTPDRLERLVDAGGAIVGWKYTVAADDSVETYDAGGKLASITQRNGRTTTLTYSTSATPIAIAPKAGFLIAVTDHFGRDLGFTYDGAFRVKQMTDPAENVYKFYYDEETSVVLSGQPESLNLTSIEFPDGRKRLYHYNEQQYTSNINRPNALTGITGENGDRFGIYTYDPTSRVFSTEHAGGVNRYTFAYDESITTVTDPLNSVRIYSFSTSHGVSRNSGISGPACPYCGPASQTYDANGFLQSKTDWNGHVTTYLRQDPNGRLDLETSRTEAVGTSEERTITTLWHSTFRLPTLITEYGRTTAFQLDPVTGDVLTRTVTDTVSGRTRTWNYTYITAGRLHTVDGPRTDVSDVATYDYYPDDDSDLGRRGNLHTITNALWHVTSITSYDANGRPLVVVDPNQLATTLEYWPRGWLKSRTVGVEVTGYDYYPSGLLSKVTQPDGSYIEYAYDPARRLTEIKDNVGNKIVYTLDAMGNRTKDEIFDQSGTLRQRHERIYDTLNRLWKDIGGENPAGAITEYGYDHQGNLTKVIYPYGDVDPLGNQRDFGYDALNRLRTVTDPKEDGARGLTQYFLNPLDQLTSVTDPMYLTTGYGLDALDNLNNQSSPDTGSSASFYDDAGNLTSRTDARGKTTVSQYDALNRLTRVTYDNGTESVYTHDQGQYAIGRLTRITDPGGRITEWTYDQHGRVESRQQTLAASTLTLDYGYDSFGRLSTLTYPSGKVVTYGYDAAGRINSVLVGSQMLLTNIGYHPFGQPTTAIWRNGSVRTRSFDLDGRMSSFDVGPVTVNLGYDNASRITSRGSASFFYDNLDRLERYVPASGSARTYTYDANGNRRTFTIGPIAQDLEYTDPFVSNRLLAVTPGTPALRYQYDAAGNVTNDATRSFVYNDAGRLVQMQQGSNTTKYAYNPLGERVLKTGPFVAGGVNAYLYDEAGHLVGEYGPGTVLQETVWLYNTPIGVMHPSGALFAVHTDHLGTPRLITSAANQVRWRWDFDPFGVLPANGNPSGLGTFTYNLRFPGQFYDAESALHYNYFRDYDPQIGRYIESDPIGLAGGTNTFGYVENNPIGAIDAQGLASCIYSISTGRMTCISNVNDKPVFLAMFASGNNQGGTLCKNNPKCTSISGQGPIPQGLWIWNNDPLSTKPDGRRLQPWIGNKTIRGSFATHSCLNAFGPSTEIPFCSKGCITGDPADIQRLNKLLDSETGNVLLVVD